MPFKSITEFAKAKQESRPVSMVTCYDYTMARLVAQSAVDCILVGDSAGMVMAGYSSTVPVTLNEIIYHAKSVRRGAPDAFMVVDLPFLSYHTGPDEAVKNAGRIMKETGANAVKLEGGEDFCDEIWALVRASIPVMGHLGFTPQSVNVFGGYKLQGRDTESAIRLVEDCLALEAAGAFAVVLELVPAELAALVSEELTIPTIGIGAGGGCDGQVQVFHDLLGLGTFTPKHAKRYADVGAAITGAVAAYAADVRAGDFPGEANLSHLDADVVAELERVLPLTEGED